MRPNFTRRHGFTPFYSLFVSLFCRQVGCPPDLEFRAFHTDGTRCRLFRAYFLSSNFIEPFCLCERTPPRSSVVDVMTTTAIFTQTASGRYLVLFLFNKSGERLYLVAVPGGWRPFAALVYAFQKQTKLVISSAKSFGVLHPPRSASSQNLATAFLASFSLQDMVAIILWIVFSCKLVFILVSFLGFLFLCFVISFLKSGAKVILFFDMCKFFTKKIQKKMRFLNKTH